MCILLGKELAMQMFPTAVSTDEDGEVEMEMIQGNIITRRVEDDEEQHQQVYIRYIHMDKKERGITLARKANDSSGGSAG